MLSCMGKNSGRTVSTAHGLDSYLWSVRIQKTMPIISSMFVYLNRIVIENCHYSEKLVHELVMERGGSFLIVFRSHKQRTVP